MRTFTFYKFENRSKPNSDSIVLNIFQIDRITVKIYKSNRKSNGENIELNIFQRNRIMETVGIYLNIFQIEPIMRNFGNIFQLNDKNIKLDKQWEY